MKIKSSLSNKKILHQHNSLLNRIVILFFFSLFCKNIQSQNQSTQTENSQTQMQQQEINLSTTSGVEIKIISKGTGIKPATGDRITVHYEGKLTNGTVFDSSYSRNQPFTFTLGIGQVIKGWDDAFAMLQTGDKATITIPASLGYGSKSAGSIPPNSTLIFDVELVSVKPKITAVPFDIAGKDTMKLKSGLEYVILKQGVGKSATPGTNVSVHYTGYLLNGTKFDSSVERGEPISFRLGEGKVIKGWDQGISLLNVGGKARLIIPYELGYGEEGFPPIIPAKSTLVFDVELMDVN
jgi:peptidylprolyl isomerase